MTEHAKLSPSSMYRIMACPASVMESTFVPEQPASQYAIHGTMLHEWVTREWDIPGSVRKSSLSREDQEYVLTCLDYLKMVIASCSTTATIKLETRVSLAPHGLEEIWGTADVIIVDLARSEIHVIDWKFGAGVPVYVEENEQLMIYGAAANGFPGLADKVTLHIVQPPMDYQGDWSIETPALDEWIFNTVTQAVQYTRQADPPYGPSDKACRFCPARNLCRARYNQRMEEAQQVFATVRKMPHITPEEKSKALLMMKNLNQYAKQLFGDAEEDLMKGRAIPGWKLVRGRSNRKWGDEQKTITWLDKNAPEAADRMFDKPKLKSPNKIEKLDRTLKKNKGFLDLITKPPGKLTLVEESDKRPAVHPEMSAEDAFAEFKS